MACKDQRHRTVFAEDDLETIYDLYKASRVNKTTYCYLSACAVELEVGSSGSVSS